MVNYENIVTKTELGVYFDVCYTENHIVPNHWHSHLEILYILDGAMYIKCNEKEYTVEGGGMFIFNSGDIHYTYCGRGVHLILLQIPYDYMQRAIQGYEQISFEQYFTKERMDREASLTKVRELLMEMAKLYREETDGYAMLFVSALNQLMYEMYKNYSVRAGESDEVTIKNMNRLKEIITYIEKHYAEPISLADIAKEFALNPEYFCRYFKKNMGFTVLEYINMVRLPRIYEDLIGTKESISDIQAKHGFTNDKVFHRMFKKVYGSTPSEIRKALDRL